MKDGKYEPHVYKLVIAPYYANYTLARRPANSDEEWEMVMNAASNKAIVKKMVLDEIDKIFDEYDYGVAPPRKRKDKS